MKITDWLLPWRAKRILSEMAAFVEREDLTAKNEAAMANEEIRSLREQLLSEKRKVRALTVWIRLAHRLDEPSTGQKIKDILQKANSP